MKTSVKMLSAGLIALGIMLGGSQGVRAADLDPATIAAAKTPADHEAIAKAYEEQAASFESQAEMHKNISKTYGQPGGKPWMESQVKHCDKVAADLRAAAREERALAAEHHKMAKTVGGASAEQ